ncbi:MAG: hypothetical protein H6909_05045 [Rickettsiaceae bacterium]|nr:hypothetical protein [Rickettsiaceae bacterium]
MTTPTETTLDNTTNIQKQAFAAYNNIEEQGGFFSYYTTIADRANSIAEQLKQKRQKLYEDIQGYFMSLQTVQFGMNTAKKIHNSSLYQVTTDKTTEAINTILNSTLFKLATSRLVLRSITAILIIATSGPIVATIGLATMGLGVAVDTFQLGATRRLKHEHSKVLQYLNLRAKQDFMLNNIAPDLKKILANQLIQVDPRPIIKNEAHHKISGINWSIISSAGKAILKTGRGIINSSLKLMTSSVNVVEAASLASGFFFFLLELRQQKSISVFNNNLRDSINQYCQNPQAPIYKDRMQLDQLTRAQRVQSLALERTICDIEVMRFQKQLATGNLDEIQKVKIQGQIIKRYQENLARVENMVKEVRNSRGITANIMMIGENFTEAHNPFSKYNDISTVKKSLRKPSELSRLTKIIQDNQKNLLTKVQISRQKQMGTYVSQLQTKKTAKSNKINTR